MKLSLQSELALISLIHLVRVDTGAALREIATAQHLPVEPLAETLSVLISSGYLEQAAGQTRLVKDAGQISVAEIIRLFDGALAPLEPVSSKGYAAAPMDHEQKLSGLFEQIQAEISDRLEATTIADLA